MSISLFDKKEKVNLLLDIGNGSISGALVLYSDKEKPKLLYSNTAKFPIDEKLENSVLLKSMEKLLDEVLLSIIKNGFAQLYFKKNSKHISKVLISFSSPWFVSKTKNIHLTQDTKFVVTEKFIANVLEVEEKNFEKELAKPSDNLVARSSDGGFRDGEEYGNSFGKELKVIENIILQTKINGYEIKNSIDKKTKNLDASIYMSVASKSVLDTVHKQVFKHTHISDKNIHIHTFPLITFSVIRDIFPAQSSFLIIDITGEVTDLSLISNDTIVQTFSFPCGRNFIIRQIAKKIGVTVEIAESLLHMQNAKQSDDQTNLKISEILSDAEKEWSIYFEDAFTELSKNNTLPSFIFMTAENDIASIYSDFIKLPKTDSTLTFRKNAHIVNINEDILNNSYITDKRFPSNEFIAILATFFANII